MGSDNDTVEAFIPLADYAAPPMPTQELFRRYIGRVQSLIGRRSSQPFIADDKLRTATLDRLNEVVAPPACGPLLAELDEAICAWRAEPTAASHIKVVILPPCDDNDIVETWARQAGHHILEAPSRDALVASSFDAESDLSGDGMLVIPRLEAWFLRHRRGLRAVRRLLAALDVLRRPVVIGCNSWAWAYLGKAVGAELLLPDPITFRPFDQARLHQWFSQLADAEATGGVRFRLPSTGEDVLERDETGKLKTNYLQTLAGRSIGIPWVAWHLWRRSLHSRDEDTVLNDAAAVVSDGTPGEQTLWIAALDEYVLPGADEQSALFVLHALLIHGPMTPQELRLVLPIVGESNIAPVLAKAGFVERRGATYACRAAAYPVMREGLAKAGLPSGEI